MSVKQEDYGVFALSQSQRNIWQLEMLYPKSPMNNICTSIRIKGRIDIALVTKCINRVLEQNLSLRIRIGVVNDRPCQFHVPYKEEKFSFFDFSATTEEGILRWENTVAQSPMAIKESPLYQFFIFKVDEKNSGILIKIHHLICDGWSIVDLANQISSTYLALLSGEDVKMEAMPDYERHVLREKEYLDSPMFDNDREYWMNQLGKFRNQERAFLKKNNSSNVSPAGERLSFRLSAVMNQAIADFCISNRVAPFTVYCIALAVHMRRVSNCENICFGVPIINRPEFEDKQTGGMYVSTLPYLFKVDTTLSVTDMAIDLTDNWYDLLRHQRFPFTAISALADQLEQDGKRLFDIALSYQDSKIFRNNDATLTFSGKWIYSGFQAEELIIHLTSLEGENRFAIDYDYLTQIYSREDIEDIHKHILKILAELLSHRQTPVRELNLLDDTELEKVLYTFNSSNGGYIVPTIAEAFDRVVKKKPGTVALICDGQKIRYKNLYERVLNIAGHIRMACQGKKIKENIIALCMPRGFDLVASMLAVSFSGNAWVILPPTLPKARLFYLIEDSNAAALVTLSEYGPLFEGAAGAIIFTDCLAKTDWDCQLPVPLEREDLAYLVYTSGSSGMPKGVLIEQGALTNFAEAMGPIYGSGGVLSFSNIGFDVFILESICALLNGKTVILALDEQSNDPSALADLIKRYGVQFFAITPSRLAVYCLNPRFAKVLNRMKDIVCGGELFTDDLLKRLTRLTKARIYNQYGPSETTIGVSLKCVSQSSLLSAGKPMENCSLYVLDENLNPLPIGAIGELYIGGAGVGRGYHNNDEATRMNFMADKFKVGQRMYRSGDIAKWDKDGEIHIIGRHDAQVKLNGYRLEPQEITAALLTHPQVEQAAVNVIKKKNGGNIAAYYTAQDEIPEAELYQLCSAALPSYMIPHFFVWVDAIPLTENGKIAFEDLEKLIKDQVKRNPGEGRPDSKAQQMVLDIFKDVLERYDLTVDSPYFRSGGDSLNALAVIAQLEEKTGIQISIGDLRRLATPHNIAEKINASEAKAAAEKKLVNRIRPVKRESYPLTSVQKSILFSSFSDATGIAYNMPGGFVLPFRPDADRLADAFRSLIAAEDILRTSFVFEGANAVAKVHDSVNFDLEEISAESYEEAFKVFVRPFDLNKPPLIRAGVWYGEGETVLLLDHHHIINDGEGTPILLEKLDTLYSGHQLQDNGLSYKDFACCQQECGASLKAVDYWTKKLSGFEKPLMLPTDSSRAEDFDHKGNIFLFKMETHLSEQIDKFCSNHNITAYTLFSTAYAILLSAVAEQYDFVIGTPVAGRTLPETRQMIGPFINTMPLRFQLERETCASQYLQKVSSDITNMLDNTDIDQEKYISLAKVDRGSGHNGLYNVMITMRPDYENSFVLGGQPITYLPLRSGSAKMELVLEVVKNSREYSFAFEYAAALFANETIEFYSRSFITVVEDIVKNPGKNIDALETISFIDKHKLLKHRADGKVNHVNMTLDVMADSYAALFPDADAILFGDTRISYARFSQRSDSIAGQLAELGARQGDVIGIYCDRTPDLIYGTFGIMKCGAAYLPLASQLPQERISQMLDAAGARIVLCDRKVAEIDAEKYEICLISPDDHAFSPVSGRSTKDMAQVLFTSGSTGQPKGIMNSYHALSSLLFNLQQIYESGGVKKGVLCSSNVLFDSFTIEVVIPLAVGISVVMADQDEVSAPWMLAQRIKQNEVEFMVSTPSRMKMLLEDESFAASLSQIKVLILGGEPVSSVLAQKLCDACSGHVYNLYGPAEASVFVSGGLIEAGKVPTIGHPMPNARIYILNEKMRPVMPTVRGEICIGGDCLSDGYIGRPDLTRAAFVEDPFIPGEILYRTGDMARILADGRIEFLGRKDDQVKLNGQRIELTEIAGSMMDTGLVADAAVIMVKNPNEESGSALCGFVVPYKGQAFDETDLLTMLGKTLPCYMIPAKIIIVDEIPLTITGKINTRVLLETASAAWRSGEIKEKHLDDEMQMMEAIDQNDPEVIRKVLLKIWKEVLGAAEINEEKSFFEQGGTSLAAMNLLIQYFKRGWRIKLSTFYEKPTLREQLGYICPISEQEPGLSASSEKVTNDKAASILITGATGFLGAHIVYELICSKSAVVYCLVRGEKIRLQEALEYYFGKEWVKACNAEIIPLTGDISRPDLGMEKREYEELSGKINIVYHCAADVRHYVDEEIAMSANVDGTRKVIEFCEKNAAELVFISTLSVAGERICREREWCYVNQSEVVFDENCYDIGQNWHDNVYVRSKFLAELEVKKAMERGLGARILRVGQLVGRTSDGKFQRNPKDNYFYNVITGIARLGAVPSNLYDIPLQLTPIDSCAKAAVLMMNGKASVGHLTNPHGVTIGMIVETLIQTAQDDSCSMKLEQLSLDAFTNLILEKLAKDPVKSAVILNSLISVNNDNDIRVRIVSSSTNEVLAQLGFSWGKLDVAMILREFVEREAVNPV